jgi:hypothetical protein
MKKLLLLFVFVQQLAYGQFYTNYFEGSFNSLTVSIASSSTNIWQIGKPAKPFFSAASTTPNVIVTDTLAFYPTNNVSSFTFTYNSPFFNPAAPLAVQWKQKLDCEQGKDGGIVEFSTNGTVWQNAHNNTNVYQFYGFQPANKDTLANNEYAFSGRDNTWRDIWLCILPNVLNSNGICYFRFTFKSDAVNTNQEGWMIDNLTVHGTFFHPVKENSKLGRLTVYPSITSGIVNVELMKNEEYKTIDNIELIDQNGKTVERYGQNYSKVVLDISAHRTGIYYLKVTINKKVSFHKVIYEKPN